MELTFLHQLDGFVRGFPLLQEYNLLERLAIVLIYAILAKVVDLILIRSLRRLAQKTRLHFDDFLIDFFHRPFLITVILLGVLHACSMEPQLSNVSALIIPNGSKTLILMVWWGAVFSSLSKTGFEEATRILGGRHIDPDIFLLFKNVSRVLSLFLTAVNFQLLLWVRDPREKGRQTHLLLKEVYRVFNENEVSIPFPQRDVYIRKTGDRGQDVRV
jgi:small-conductance mechanosensitive channel